MTTSKLAEILVKCGIVSGRAADGSNASMLGRISEAAALITASLAAVEPDGFICEACGDPRPPNNFIYEVERDGQWIRPCCFMCARKGNSRRSDQPVSP